MKAQASGSSRVFDQYRIHLSVAANLSVMSSAWQTP
jgi:hypothetical protein